MPVDKLKVGSFGSDVRELQSKLRQHGFDLPPAEVEREFFGPGTQDTVRDLQRKFGLKVTGAVDAATAAALQTNGFSKNGSSAASASSKPNVKPASPPPPVARSNGNGASQPRPQPQPRVTTVAPRTAAARTGDFASRDNEARVTFYVLLWKRKGLNLTAFDDYWRDVHGPVCARLPGQFQYWQFHVAHNDGGIFPAVEGVNYTTPAEDQFDGIAELTFRSVNDRQTWFDAAAILMDDEHNIFSKAIGYVTEQGKSKTYIDSIPTGDPNGDLNAIKFHVMVRQRTKVSVDDFRSYMTNSFAANVVRNSCVMKFRLHLFEPPDLSRPDAAGVVHYEGPDKQYQAAYEIAFKNHLDMETFFASSDYANAVADQAQFVKLVNPMPERNPYTFVYNGQMTLAGERGSRTAELITALGATNQLRDDIHDLMIGGGSGSYSAPKASYSSNGNGGYVPASGGRGTKPNMAQIFSPYNRD